MMKPIALPTRPIMLTFFAPILRPSVPNSTTAISEIQPAIVMTNDISVCCQPYCSLKMPNSVLVTEFQNVKKMKKTKHVRVIPQPLAPKFGIHALNFFSPAIVPPGNGRPFAHRAQRHGLDGLIIQFSKCLKRPLSRETMQHGRGKWRDCIPLHAPPIFASRDTRSRPPDISAERPESANTNRTGRPYG